MLSARNQSCGVTAGLREREERAGRRLSMGREKVAHKGTSALFGGRADGNSRAGSPITARILANYVPRKYASYDGKSGKESRIRGCDSALALRCQRRSGFAEAALIQ